MKRRLMAAMAAVIAIAGAGTAAIDPDSAVRKFPEIQLMVGEYPISPFGACPVNGDLEGVFGPGDMPAYLQCIVPIVDGWINQTYVSIPHPNGYIFVPPGVSGIPAPGCQFNDQTLAYCRTNATVYLGAAAIWQQYSTLGDGAPPMVLAHEVGHHFQNMQGMPSVMGPAAIRFENQADCAAGAFMAYSRNLGLLARDDIYDLAGSLVLAASAEGPGRDHGTVSERLTAFDIGYLSGLPNPLYDCNGFVPEIRLVV